MSALEIPIGSYQALGFDLAAAIEAYQGQLAAHAATVDVPAPMVDSLVERITKEHGGQFVIVPPPPVPDEQPLPKDPAFYRGLDAQVYAGTTLAALELQRVEKMIEASRAEEAGS